MLAYLEPGEGSNVAAFVVGVVAVSWIG